MAEKIAVIGLGNTLRRDDGIGIVILEALIKGCRREGVEYLNFGVSSFDLVHRLRDYEKSLLIDGIEGSLAPGELKIFKLEDIKYNINNSAISTHEFDLRNIFELCQRLGVKAEIYVAGIQVKDILFGSNLSQPIKDNLRLYITEISDFIDKNLLDHL